MHVLVDNLEIVLTALLATIVLLGIFSVYLYRAFRQSRRVYCSMLKGLDKENLEEILSDINVRLKAVESTVVEQRSQITTIERQLLYTTQGVGIVRFNAFNDVGGELSFALAMLDGEGTGFVLSSVFGRVEARVYAKPVSRGVATHALSKEEEQAIAKAQGRVM